MVSLGRAEIGYVVACISVSGCWRSCTHARRHPPVGWAALCERGQVEHILAQLGAWRSSAPGEATAPAIGGLRKNLLDLGRTAVIHNMHVLQHLPDVVAVPRAA